ncbi:hypothetical protein FTO70_09600 [Methanosarcina sp. KYL-1]|uniref:DUF5316 domain-containing protein n=1 Tax=Methanosarcina sp. KYL-1 TaxID=2602068 RepID=UPI0021009E62|nr:DUF5316 domain-containing protein [Methanosarcina sp. KYL-1]MCQ1535929.1 hypothetical protein [Methanosarcina sp. KYL-1]
MRNLLLIGVGTFVIALIAAFLLEDPTVILKIAGSVGLIFLVVAGILSGSFLSGNRIRANYYSQGEDERKEKSKLSSDLFFTGLLTIVLSAIAYYLMK